MSSRVARRSGLAFVELLVVLAVVSLLGTLILPAIQRSREAARNTQCKDNLRKFGVALQTSPHGLK
ncbi:MAG: hypothetical protein JWM11_6644 [Planctomycetaceae bacterium]|nr:hypothetical protein [Planctomycetaceae bacterium]